MFHDYNSAEGDTFVTIVSGSRDCAGQFLVEDNGGIKPLVYSFTVHNGRSLVFGEGELWSGSSLSVELAVNGLMIHQFQQSTTHVRSFIATQVVLLEN